MNNSEWKFDESSKTLAGGIAVTNPPRINQVVEAVKNSSGIGVEVSENETISWHGKLARWGFLSEITCAAAMAGTEKLIKLGALNKISNVVIPITGSGLKDIDKVRF